MGGIFLIVRRLVLLLWVAWTLPTASATPVEGELVLQGMRFQDRVAGDLALHALYVNDTSGITVLELDAARVEMRIWTRQNVESRVAQPTISYTLDNDERTLRYTHARVTLHGSDHDGWLGARGVTDGSVSLAAGADLSLQAYSEIGQTMNRVPDTQRPNGRYFMEPLRRPHILVDSATAFTFEGDGVLRISGPDLAVEARENRTRIPTGLSRDEGDVGRAEVVWMTLTFTDGKLRMDGLRDTRAQAYGGDLSWNGAAMLREPEGELVGPQRTWLARDTGEVVQGALRATLLAREDGIRTHLEGDLATATMATTARIPTPGTAAIPWLLLGLGVMLGGGATYIAVRRRARREEPDAEDLVDLALQASEAGDHARALAWIARALARAPNNERVALEEASVLEAAGEDDRALRALRALAQRTGSAEASWRLARGLARRGAHADDVVPWIVRAVEADAMLVLEVDEDEILAPYVRRSDVAGALAAARMRIV